MKGDDPLSLINRAQEPKVGYYENASASKLGPTPQTPVIDSYFDQVRQKQNMKEIDLKFRFEEGEVIVLSFDVKELNKLVDGKLVLTNYRIKFISQYLSELSDELFDQYSVPYGYFQRLKTQVDKKSNYIEVTTKDQRYFKYRFESPYSFQRALDAILQLSQVRKHKNFFSYDYTKSMIKNKPGVKTMDQAHILELVMQDFRRMHVDELGERFKLMDLSYFKKQYKIQYPTYLYVAQNLLIDDHIKGSSSIRTFGRFPALAYLHQQSQAAIWRSAEPLQHILTKRCLDDETYIKLISGGNKGKQELYIFSARSVSEKESKQLGQESPINYPNTKIITYNLSHLQKVAESFEKVWEISNSFGTKKQTKFLSKLDKSRWLHIVESQIRSSMLVGKAILDHQQNVLIYCPNGQNGSCILSSLAQIIIDPYYRTYEGFKALLYKEWVYFGHNFIQRSNLKNDFQMASDSSFSPLFILFLDCLHQLIKQNLTQFEFTADLLVTLAYHCFSNKFFEFLQPTENQPNISLNSSPEVKMEQKEEDQYISIFQTLELRNFGNKLYQREKKQALNFNSLEMVYWKEYFGRYEQNLMSSGVEERFTARNVFYETRTSSEHLKIKLLKNLRLINKIKLLPRVELSQEDQETLSSIESALNSLNINY